jgi:uncharacterized damage-inducible protein DinB
MDMKQTLIKYAHYNQWANAIMLKLVKSEGTAFLDKENSSSHTSLRKTILHMADAEYLWYTRLTEMNLEQALTGIPSKIGADMDVLSVLDQKHLAFLQSQEDSYFSKSTSYKNLKGDPFTTVNSSIFWQVFNHATFHRGQVVMMMRQNGYKGSIESTDFIAFDRLG